MRIRSQRTRSRKWLRRVRTSNRGLSFKVSRFQGFEVLAVLLRKDSISRLKKSEYLVDFIVQNLMPSVIEICQVECDRALSIQF
jgi:hypothetical protein